jgi:hypothetical protein
MTPTAAMAVLALALAAPGVAAAQGAVSDAPRTAPVTATTASITIDGALDEEVWRAAPTIGGLTQRQPREGATPSEQTDVRLLRDDTALYVGVMSYDSEPDRIVGTEMARDAALRSEDRVEIVLDTYGDQQSGFYFATNPAGALVDGLVFANGQSNLEWDAIWNVRTRRTPQGWSAEFAIPFKSLNFPAGGSRWGFNVSRTIQRKLEEARWSGARLQTDFFQVSEAGRITELDGLSQGVGLQARPFMAGRWLRPAAGHGVLTGRPGLDITYNVTPSLKVTGTVNTDFGETEVDARQINLTRFSLFFPEKRSFFLEDAGVFAFSNAAVTAPNYLSPARAQVIPFFSRQIGLVAGEEVPIEAGVKLTGKAGRTDIGVLNVNTGDARRVEGKNFFVARLRQNFLRQSYIGAIVTSGDPTRATSATTTGADLALATSNLFGRRQNLSINAFGVKGSRAGTSGNDLSYGGSVEYPNDIVELELMSRTVEGNFDPALGFVSRRNIRVLRASGRYSPRPRSFLGLQQHYNGLVYNRFTRLDTGQVEAWNAFVVFPDWHFKSGDSLHALLTPDFAYERLFVPFEISPGVVLPAGDYRSTRWTNSFASAGKRRLQGNVKWIFGSYWSGHADEVTTSVTYKVPPRVTVTASAVQTFARLPQGDFTARIVSSQVNYTASPFLAFSNLLQYDNRSRNMSWQGRLRWTVQPGNDLFIVVNQGWIHDPDERGFRLSPHDTQIATKTRIGCRAPVTGRRARGGSPRRSPPPAGPR